MVKRRSTLTAAAALVVLAAPAPASAARHRPPELTRIRCVPAASATCKSAVRVPVGRQLQLSGKRIAKGMRVSFRWTSGALATKLDHSRVGYVARVPPGTRAGSVSVTISDKAGRRSNIKKITVTAPPQVGSPSPARGTLPPVFAGNGMWIWYVSQSSGGDVNAIAAQAHAAGISTLFIKSADGDTNWPQFNTALVGLLHANGLRACAWQYVYGADPAGEAAQGAAAAAAGADCLVIDAEKEYEGRYAQAQQYMGALRAAVGPNYPIGLTSFPYVDYHPRLPYSVFLAPGAAQANLPQVYWQTIGGTVDAVSGHTVAHNRLYGVPMAPLGQTYNVPPEDIARFRAVWAAYGSAGLSWWSWQATPQSSWDALAQPAFPATLPDPGWPALELGNKGDEVVWLQEHLGVGVTATFDAATDQAVRNLQAAHGLEVTGVTDPLTWQQVLAQPLVPHVWTS